MQLMLQRLPSHLNSRKLDIRLQNVTDAVFVFHFTVEETEFQGLE
jgi:hypothetical protein